MDNREPEKPHPAVEFLLKSLVQDKAQELQLPEDAYVELHARIDQLEKAKELSSLAQSLLEAVTLDQQHRAKSAQLMWAYSPKPPLIRRLRSIPRSRVLRPSFQKRRVIAFSAHQKANKRL